MEDITYDWRDILKKDHTLLVRDLQQDGHTSGGTYDRNVIRLRDRLLEGHKVGGHTTGWVISLEGHSLKRQKGYRNGIKTCE